MLGVTYEDDSDDSDSDQKESANGRKRKARRKSRSTKRRKTNGSSDSDSDGEDARAQRKRARLARKEEKRRRALRGLTDDEEPSLAGLGKEQSKAAQSGYNVTYETKEPTEEEMEQYHMSRRREDDPMKDFLENS